MTIKVGDKLPDEVSRDDRRRPAGQDHRRHLQGQEGRAFRGSGAYTGTCHKMHLPSIFLNAYAIKNKGVDTIAIVSVNDAFVMNAWKRDTDQRDEATFLADGNADFTRRSAWSSTHPAMASASAPSATRCWSTTAP